MANRANKSLELLTFLFLSPLALEPRIDLMSKNVVFIGLVILAKRLLCLDLLVLESWELVLNILIFFVV